MSTVETINWELCCLCQLDKPGEVLQSPKEQGLLSLENDLKDFNAVGYLPSTINVTISQLNNGSGIAATLFLHKACYHKSCRSYCSSSRVKRARDKLEKDLTCPDSPKRLRPSGDCPPAINGMVCVICGKKDDAKLCIVSSDGVDANLKTWAKTNKNFLLVGRLIAAHTANTHYHHQCYVQLRDSARATERRESMGPTPPQFDPIICAQIVTFIENSDTTLFKLSELCEMYRKLLSDQGHPCHDRRIPNSTRFKNHLLALLPEWSEFSKGNEGRKDVFISHKAKVANELAKTYRFQFAQDDALIFMRAAVMMHELCLQSHEAFDGSFPPNCLTTSVSKEMRSFFNVVLRGPSILDGCEKIGSDADLDARDKIACNISQLLTYNTTKGTHHAVPSANIRHNKERETPFPLYYGLKLHGNGRDKKQIGIAHDHGLSVSYSRILEVKLGVARAVCARHAEDGVVVPSNSLSKVFTTHDVDNLDNKAQGNLSQHEFHGYALSVTNHVSHENTGVKRPPIRIDPSDTSIPKLPENYMVQPPVELASNDVYAPKLGSLKLIPHGDIESATLKDEAWMAHVKSVLTQDALEKGDIITWSGYNSLKASEESVKPPAEIGIYPLFPDKAACASSMKHAMELTMKGTEFLNPGQTSVLGADQPLYAIIKRIQWQYPETFGEDKLVVMMGALHTEDKMHLMIGKLLRDSGWATILSQAEILTSGRAQSALNEHHIKRTRYAHQVSLMSLYLLKQTAYSEYCESVMGPPESFQMWDRRLQTVPLFMFWSTIMDLELLMCRFVRALREGNFPLYVQACDELCGWFHALDHTNYARWLPVHVRDMVTLEEKHPEVQAEFMKGNFVVQKSARKFSLMAKDQAHEQSNKTLQMHGGAAGLYENPDALTLFMLAGPDCARMIEEFEAIKDTPTSYAHHEEGHSLQTKFKNDVQSFVTVVEQMGNPFLATHQELIALDTKNVMEQAVVESLSQMCAAGKALHADYVTRRLENASVPVSDIIGRNKFLTFANRPDSKIKGRKDCGIQKQNMILVTQLFLSLQSRPAADMMDFFRFENQKEPPSLSDRGSLRFGTKSDILQCLKVPTGIAAGAKQATVVVLDMAAVIHMVRPTVAKTFNEYIQLHIAPYLEAQVNNCAERLDLVWDNYPEENNLKSLTHQRRGNGPRTMIGDGCTPIPKHEWNGGFLKNEENKKELFSFISRQISKNDMKGKLLLTTHLESVISNRQCDLTALESCNHSEADTRILLHLSHAAEHGHKTAYVRTVDSDVVVLAVRFFDTMGLSELWVGFGTGKNYRDIPVHNICSTLGESKCLALPLFHSLTGCDTTSQFLGCGKKTAWAAWTGTPELTDTLVALTNNPDLFCIESEHMRNIENFVVLMYSKGCGAAGVNEARHCLFTTGSKSLENLPPTQAALFQHVKRALLQASFFWNQATSVQQNIPDFSNWGWCKTGSSTWQPLWTTLSDASNACSILLQCGCTKACSGRCKCKRAGVRCTTLCKCEGGCVNNEGSNDQ